MSGHLDHLSGGTMAIPVEGGAQEQMDVSTEDNPSYVSIKAKGPGRPIRIRADELSQFSNGNYTGPVGPNAQCMKYGMDNSAESFIDKRTGSALTFESSVADKDNFKVSECDETEDQELNEKIESAKFTSQLDISEHDRALIDANFRSQASIVSIGTKSKPEILNTPPKKKYQLNQNGAKKNVGTKKGSPGKIDSSLKLVKRSAPYPNWMNYMPLKDIVGKPFVDEDGNIHQWELQLVPVMSKVGLKRVDTMQLPNDQSTKHDIISEGSIDRPPDEAMHLEDNYIPGKVVYAVATTQPSTTNHNFVGNNMYSFQNAGVGTISAPNSYSDNDQPLDLTVEPLNQAVEPLDLTVGKPLDLSMKDSSDSHSYEGQVSGIDKDDEEVDHVMGNPTLSEKSNINEYRTQCSSVLSTLDKESVQGDETYDSLTDPCPRETEQQDVVDGNLPSLGKLSLEVSNQVQSSSVQDSIVQQALVNSGQFQEQTVSGQQNILNLVTSGQVSWGQLLTLYHKNQMQKSANFPSAASKQTATTPEPNINHLHSQQAQMAVPVATGELDIPAPAMPNLCSLELANNEGRILVKKEEAMKNKLKEKLLQRNNTRDDN